MNLKNLQLEIRSMIFEKVTVGLSYDRKELLTEISHQIKNFFGAFLAGVYEYDEWKNTFVLGTVSEREKAMLKPFFLKRNREKGNMLPEEKVIIQKAVLPEGLVSFLIPVTRNGSVPGYLFLAIEEEKAHADVEQKLSVLTDDLYLLLTRNKNISRAEKRAVKYELLYRVTVNLHSSMESKTILEEVIEIVREAYPSFTCCLHLIQEFPEFKQPMVKKLSYDGNPANEISLRTLLTEKPQFEKAEEGGHSVHVPLKGKQGVYGVLEVSAPEADIFPEEEVEFLTALAFTAGSAMENAELYQQSRQMVLDLQMINKTSHSLNSNLRLADTTIFMKRQFQESFEAEETAFIIYEEGEEHYHVHGESTSFFNTAEGEKLIGFMHHEISERREALFYGDFSEEFDHFFSAYQSVMAVPMIQFNEIKGFILLMHKEKHFFPFQSFELLQSLVQHLTLAFANSILREKLETSVVTDYLSGLYTRRYLDEQIQKDRTKKVAGTFLLLDIDNFKQVNDTFGHRTGDAIIVQVAELIKKGVKDCDTAARWGGEELAVYMPDVSLEEGIKIATSLVKEIESSTEPRVTVSVGVSAWGGEEEDSSSKVFQRADEALYQAKKAGKNCVVAL